jgi:hypothetical protein
MTLKPGVEGMRAARRDLLGRVQAGKLSPEEADGAAVAAGLGSLSRYIDPEEFWPTAKSHWTLPMVLAWIAWRTYGEVREWDAGYVPMRRDWGLLDQPSRTGQAATYGLFTRKRPTSAQFRQWGSKRFGPWVVGRDGRPVVLPEASPAEAMSALWWSLENGDLVAHGVRQVGKPRVEIPARDWIDLKVVADGEGREELHVGRGTARERYRDILFAVRSVEAIWGPHNRSGLPDRAEFEYSPMVNDLAARSDLFQRVRLEDLDAPPSQQVSRGHRDYNNRDLKALKLKNKRLVDARKSPLTVAETREWALDRGITRTSMRKMLTELKRTSGELRRSRGQTGP